MEAAYSDSTVTAKLVPLDLRNYNHTKKKKSEPNKEKLRYTASIKQMEERCKS